MDKLKFIVFSIIVLSLMGLVGYWSVATIQSGTEYKLDQKVGLLERENKELKKEVQKLTSELEAKEPKLEEPAPIVEDKPEATPKPEATAHKYQDLIGELQKLVDANIFMKLKSVGTRVGTVQQFLNIYNNTSNRVDNEYGPGTAGAVTAFQKAQGLTADGEAGPNTFRKMIEWLKKQ